MADTARKPSDEMAASSESHLLSDDQVREFITNGFLLLKADVAPDLHVQIEALLRFASEQETWYGNNILSRVPSMHRILRCPVVDHALISLLGPGYYLHPHRAIHTSTPIDDSSLTYPPDVDAPPMGKGSAAGSGWHQDAQSPLSRARHHRPRYLIGFYFPHDTPLAMGPTRLQAGSHLYANPVTPHAVVLPDFVAAGTFMLVHFDMVHAGFPNRGDRTRYMVKFVFTRTTHPTAPTWNHADEAWRRPKNCLPEFDIPEAWGAIWHWMRGAPRQHQAVPNAPYRIEDLGAADQADRLRAIYGLAATAKDETDVKALADALTAHAHQNKHQRQLAKDDDGNDMPRDDIRGYPRRWNERAIVMEDAAYALAQVGEPAIPVLERLLTHDDPWMQINAAFALGEIGPAARNSTAKLAALLDSPESTVVRQALDALGCIGCGLEPALPAIHRLLATTRLEWQEAQVMRGWVAQDQVRLNAAFALLGAINAGEHLDKIEAILTDCLDEQNGYTSAVATEALIRINTPTATQAALRYLSDRRWDDTLMGRVKPY